MRNRSNSLPTFFRPHPFPKIPVKPIADFCAKEGFLSDIEELSEESGLDSGDEFYAPPPPNVPKLKFNIKLK